MYVHWSIHGTWSQKCLCSLATRLKTLTTKLFQKHFHAIKLSYSSYQPIYLVPLWHKVYSALAWSVEAAVTLSGQRKDTANQDACWSMPSSKDKECIYRNTGTCTSVQALCIPTWREQRANRGTEIKLVVLLLCPFLAEKHPRTWETSCFQFCHIFVAPESHLYPLLTAGFTLARLHMRVWIPRQNKLAQKHTFHSQFYMQVHVRSFGRVTRTSKHHQYELSKELFHHVLWKGMSFLNFCSQTFPAYY